MSVFVVEDHPLYAFALESVISSHPELNLSGTASDGLIALKCLRSVKPDVALIDLSLPRLDGLELVNTLKDENMSIKPLVISGTAEPSAVHRAIRSGAVGFLSKDADAEEITNGILAAARGGAPLSHVPGRSLIATVQADMARQRLGLTMREQDVLVLVADGESTKAIAERLHVSVATVKTHLGRLYEKLEVSDRASAVAAAFRAGAL